MLMFDEIKKHLLLFLLYISFFTFGIFADPLFTSSPGAVGTAPMNLARGMLPISFEVQKKGKVGLIEGEEKANISLNFDYSLSYVTEYNQYDLENGTPYWKSSISSLYGTREYFNPTASFTFTLSQPIDLLTYSFSFSSRFSYPQEGLENASKPNSFTFVDSFGNKKFLDKDKVYAYPWYYGERTNLTNYITLSFTKNYIIDGFDAFYISLSGELGPKWLLNNISNGGITLSDFYRLSSTVYQYKRLVNKKQQSNLRWLQIGFYHYNTLSYTFGDISPQNKINSYRMRGYLSDTTTLQINGPEVIDSGTAIVLSFSLYNTLYFGGVQNERTNSVMGISYSSRFASSFTLSMFGFMRFSYSTSYYLLAAFDTTTGWRGSGEVAFSFIL